MVMCSQDQTSMLFRAFSDPTRRSMLQMITRDDLSVRQLTNAFGVGRLPVVSDGKLVGIIIRNYIIEVMYHSPTLNGEELNRQHNACR